MTERNSVYYKFCLSFVRENTYTGRLYKNNFIFVPDTLVLYLLPKKKCLTVLINVHMPVPKKKNFKKKNGGTKIFNIIAILFRKFWKISSPISKLYLKMQKFFSLIAVSLIAVIGLIIHYKYIIPMN